MSKAQRGLLVILVAALGATVAACGSSSGISTGSVNAIAAADGGGASGGATESQQAAVAKKFVDAHFKALVFNPGQPFKPPTGKRIGILTVSAANPGAAEIVQGVQQAAQQLAWQTTVVDGKGVPAEWSAGLDQLVQSRVDGIVTVGIADKGIPAAMKDAAAAKIPVSSVGAGTRLDPPIANPSKVDTDLETTLMGRMQANYMIANAQGHPRIVLITDAAIPALLDISKATEQVFSKCSGCKILESVEMGEPANWTPAAATATQAILNRYPAGTIDYLVPPYDAATQGVTQAIKAAHRTDVKVVSGGCIPNITGGIEQMRSRQGPVVYCNVTANKWMGWAGVDTLARLLVGQKPPDVGIPPAFYEDDNLPPGSGPYTSYDYKAAYKKNWLGG
jgi:ribose transport system substrate-binding protein